MQFIIKGGKRLGGSVVVRGSKNAATKMMIASLLTDEEVILDNFPAIGDTAITAELCEAIGMKFDCSDYVARLKTEDISSSTVSSLSRRNRLSVLAIGPLLSRVGYAEVPVAGGDKIGPRPVDMHLEALRSLGAKVEQSDTSIVASAPNGLKGTEINLRYPSVGATESIILSSVLAKGRTTIRNAAKEPEVIDLMLLLQKMGAIVELGSSRTIFIEGVSKLHGAWHTILPDRNEAVSFACLGVSPVSESIKVVNAAQKDLITFLNALRKIGGDYKVEKDGIIFSGGGKFNSVELETDTHPGFMTDWQQPFVILLTQASGVSVLHETVYEDRFGYAEDLNSMGARITVFSKCLGELECRFNGKGHPHSAVIFGPTPLSGAQLKVRDLRAGMAHLIAALIAQGESTIDGVEEIDRGYENIDGRLKSLGADVKRV